MDNVTDKAAEISALSDQMSEILADTPPDVRGAALADLLALLIVGHVDESGNAGRTTRLRERLLKTHVQGVHKLVDFYSRRFGL